MNSGDVINQVDQMSKSIFEYGAFTVILAVFLVLFIIITLVVFFNNNKQIKKMMDNNKEQMASILKQNNELIEKLISNKNNSNTTSSSCEENDHNKKDLVKTYIDINLVFKNICRDVLQKIQADRIGIYVFHNGNESIHGFPFFKMSCIGEWVLYGYKYGKNHADLPLHVFSNIVEKLYNDGKLYVQDISTVDKEDSIRDFISNNKIKSVIMVGIYDDNNNLAGFSVAEFKEIQDDSKIITAEKVMTTMNNSNVRDIIVDSNIREKLKEED